MSLTWHPSAALAAQDQTVAAAHTLDQIFASYPGTPFAVRFWNGDTWRSPTTAARTSDAPAFTLCLRTPTAWTALCSTPDEAELGAKYVAGEIEIEGDLYLALRDLPLMKQTLARNAVSPAALRLLAKAFTTRLSRLLHFGSMHSKRRDADAIALHYDKPGEFYELFLGPSMVYSCAYFRSLNNTLTRAQQDKMEHICRKLDLHPNERFLDIGCGWGSLVLHAHTRHGVHASGVSLSRQQVEYATQRMTAAGASKRDCHVLWSDFRDLSDVHLPFDKIASVGMCEHVGSKNIDLYFREAFKLLKPGGLFLNHGITRSVSFPDHKGSFIDRYVFPDSELLPLNEMVRAAEDAGFEVRDVEDLREHYEETLHRWVAALDQHHDQAIALTDEATFRIWKLYMTGCAEAFRRGDIAIQQMLLSKNDHGHSHAAKTRDAWYHDHSPTAAAA